MVSKLIILDAYFVFKAVLKTINYSPNIVYDILLKKSDYNTIEGNRVTLPDATPKIFLQKLF